MFLEGHPLQTIEVTHQAEVLLVQGQVVRHLDHQVVAEVLVVVQDLQVVAEDVNLNLLKEKNIQYEKVKFTIHRFNIYVYNLRTRYK